MSGPAISRIGPLMRSGHPIIGIGLNSAGLPAAIQGDACPDHPDT
jgi:hypothetical protein